MDFGGVLTTDVFASFREFCEREGIDPDTVKRLFREDPDALALLRRLERGEIEADEFSERFGAMMGVADTDGLIDRLFAGMRPDEAMHEAVRRARAGGVRTALVSNSWSSGHYDRSSLDQLFDAIVISGEVGLNKPDAEIFELAADRVGVPAGECVFVDDLRENCEEAERVGMTAVRHRDAPRTVAELEGLLGVELR